MNINDKEKDDLITELEDMALNGESVELTPDQAEQIYINQPYVPMDDEDDAESEQDTE